MRPFDLRCIDHVVLRVADMARSRRFYVDVLGCTLARERPDLGLAHLRAGASMIDLVDVSGRLGLRGGPAARRPARRGATSTMSACGSNRSTTSPSARTSPPAGWTCRSRCRRTSAPKATDPRSTSAIRTATRSNSRAGRPPDAQPSRAGDASRPTAVERAFADARLWAPALGGGCRRGRAAGAVATAATTARYPRAPRHRPVGFRRRT
ncbi:MAG TPA: VOC family protein [Lysobacter sp.]